MTFPRSNRRRTVSFVTRRLPIVLAVVAVLLVQVSGLAHAFWTSEGDGSADSATAAITAPTSVAVPAVSYDSAIDVSWSAGGGPVDGYYVERLGASPGQACGTSITALTTRTSCVDTVPADGTYGYRVVAVYRSWTADTDSSAVSVRQPAAVTFCQQPVTTAAGQVVNPPVRLCLQTADGTGAPVAGRQVTVSLLGPDGSHLQGTTTAQTDATGTATFTDLRIDQAATGYRLTGSGQNLRAATSSAFDIVAANADVLSFVSAPRTSTAATTSDGQGITVRRADPFGNAVTQGTTTVRLTSSSAGTTRFSLTPSGAAVTTATIPDGSSTVTVFYADTRSGQPQVIAAADGLVTGSQTETIRPAAATGLVVTSTALTLTADSDARSAPITVTRQDAFGNPSPATTGTVITLTSTSTTTRFAAAQAGAAVTSLSLPAQQSSIAFYVGDTRTGRPVLTAAGSGLRSGSQTETVTPAAATALVFTTAARTAAATAAASIGPLTVRRVDPYGNAVPAPTGGLSVGLGSSSAGTRVFATRSGGAAVTSVTMAAGSSTATFYYGDRLVGTPTITATIGSLTATQKQTIVPGAARKLVFLGPALTGRPSVTATLGPLTVQRQDTYGNPVTNGALTVALTTAHTTTGVYATQPSGAAISSVVIANGSSTATVWYGDTLAGTVRLGATATGLSAARQDAVLTPVATRLVVTTPVRTGRAGTTASLGFITVSRQDEFGNAVAAPAGGATMSLSSSSTGTTVFATSAAGAGITQVTVPAGSTSASVWYGDTLAGTPTVTAHEAGLTDATQVESITPGTAARLTFTTAPVAGAASTQATLGPLTVARVDTWGNQVTNSTTAATVALTTTSRTGRFAADPGGTAIRSVVIPAGQATASFSYGDGTTGSPLITVTTNGLTAANQTATIR